MGNAVRVVMKHNRASDKHDFSIYPQGIDKDIKDNAELKLEMQKAIDRKTKKYTGKVWLDKFDQVWLLLYIIGDEMDINSPCIDIESIRISPKIFNRIFLVHNAITEFHLYELNIDSSTSK